MVNFRDINSSTNAILSLCTCHSIIWPPPSLGDVSVPPLEKENKHSLHYTSQRDLPIQYKLLQNSRP
jgi:hypothetical protein